MSAHTSFEHLKFTQPEIWREVVKAMGEMESLVWNDPRVTDDLTRAEGLRYLTRLIAGGSLSVGSSVVVVIPDGGLTLDIATANVVLQVGAGADPQQWRRRRGGNSA